MTVTTKPPSGGSHVACPAGAARCPFRLIRVWTSLTRRSRASDPARQVSKSFGGQRVLSDVDLHVPGGCLYGLIDRVRLERACCSSLSRASWCRMGARLRSTERFESRLNALELQRFRAGMGMLFNALFDHMTVGATSPFRFAATRTCRPTRSPDASRSDCNGCLPGFGHDSARV